jgi:hypothetical protein
MSQKLAIASLVSKGMTSITSVRALAVLGIIAGALGFVISLAVLFPHSDPQPSVTDWMSAFGTVAGAALTGGALLLAALTYRKQVEDQHQDALERYRAQAAAVTVEITDSQSKSNFVDIALRNGSSLPIFGAVLICVDKKRNDIGQKFFNTLAAGQSDGLERSAKIVGAAYAVFTDQSGARWKRWFNGDLEELPSKVS